MQEYKYTALTGKGEEVTGIIEAADKNEAIQILRDRKLFPTTIRLPSEKEPTRENNEDRYARILDVLANKPKNRNLLTRFKLCIARKILSRRMQTDEPSEKDK